MVINSNNYINKAENLIQIGYLVIVEIYIYNYLIE